MQREGYILRSTRTAIAMISAIMAIIIISGLLTFSLSLFTQTSKSGIDLYLYEQSNLLARAAGEYARLKISESTPCSYMGESFSEDNIYQIKIAVKYSYNTPQIECLNSFSSTSQSLNDGRFGAALIDITVEVTDTTITTEPIKIFRRKLVEL